MTPPAQPDPGLDLARIVLRRAKEDARRSSSTGGSASARRQVRRGRGPSAPLVQVLVEMFAERGLHHPIAASVLIRWPAVAGPLAQHVHLAGFDEDTATLTLAVPSTAWLTQVNLLADALLKHLNEDLGPGSIRQLRVVKSDAPGVPRPVVVPEAARVAVWRPPALRPDPDIEAARRAQAQRMPREPVRARA